jgi:hypothetical protein
MTQTLQFILGDRPLSEWDAFVSEVEDLKANDYLELVKAAQARAASGG